MLRYNDLPDLGLFRNLRLTPCLAWGLIFFRLSNAMTSLNLVLRGFLLDDWNCRNCIRDRKSILCYKIFTYKDIRFRIDLHYKLILGKVRVSAINAACVMQHLKELSIDSNRYRKSKHACMRAGKQASRQAGRQDKCQRGQTTTTATISTAAEHKLLKLSHD
uniref:Uncharacterized protein n=1 Tax=Glossina austeni TaxID=7395 RepID=A0A1A9UXT4_GLOAU